jgi:hypothetical protein
MFKVVLRKQFSVFTEAPPISYTELLVVVELFFLSDAFDWRQGFVAYRAKEFQ